MNSVKIKIKYKKEQKKAQIKINRGKTNKLAIQQ